MLEKPLDAEPINLDEVDDSILGAPQWHSRPLDDNRLELRATGKLPQNWAAKLTARIARLGLSIERGEARREESGYWSAWFEVVVPNDNDYGEVYEPPSFEELETPRATGTLDRFVFGSSDEHGGSFRLEVVEAPDCVGFLASLLDLLSNEGLVPVELRLDTRNGRVFDSLWFKPAVKKKGKDRDREACRAVLRHLEQMVQV